MAFKRERRQKSQNQGQRDDEGGRCWGGEKLKAATLWPLRTGESTVREGMQEVSETGKKGIGLFSRAS